MKRSLQVLVYLSASSLLYAYDDFAIWERSYSNDIHSESHVMYYNAKVPEQENKSPPRRYTRGRRRLDELPALPAIPPSKPIEPAQPDPIPEVPPPPVVPPQPQVAAEQQVNPPPPPSEQVVTQPEFHDAAAPPAQESAAESGMNPPPAVASSSQENVDPPAPEISNQPPPASSSQEESPIASNPAVPNIPQQNEGPQLPPIEENFGAAVPPPPPPAQPQENSIPSTLQTLPVQEAPKSEPSTASPPPPPPHPAQTNSTSSSGIQPSPKMAPIPFSETRHPEGGPVIATLLANREKDVKELCQALHSLVLLKGDKDKDHMAPVLVFQEGDISDIYKRYLVTCTNRLIAFPFVNFTTFPPGFDYQIEGERFQVKGRSEWGYYQMIRFWLTRIWEHPALKPYETVMRIDTDSCFNEVNAYLPNLKHEHLLYHSQYVGLEDGKEFVVGLLDFAEQYLRNAGRVPKNALLWQFIKTTWEHHQTLPLFMTNMEVTRKSFMLSPEIKAWNEALTEKEPFGVLRKRWGDADIRFLTAAMFTSHEQIMTERASGYRHKERCIKEEIEAGINKAKNDGVIM